MLPSAPAIVNTSAVFPAFFNAKSDALFRVTLPVTSNVSFNTVVFVTSRLLRLVSADNTSSVPANVAFPIISIIAFPPTWIPPFNLDNADTTNVPVTSMSVELIFAIVVSPATSSVP